MHQAWLITEVKDSVDVCVVHHLVNGIGLSALHRNGSRTRTLRAMSKEWLRWGIGAHSKGIF